MKKYHKNKCISCNRNCHGARCRKCHFKYAKEHPETNSNYRHGKSYNNKCIICGKHVGLTTQKCRKCYHKTRKKIIDIPKAAKLYRKGWSFRKISGYFGICTYSTIILRFRQANIHVRTRTEIQNGKFGSKSRGWSGQHKILRSGYLYVYAPKYSYNKNGRIREHRLIIEKKLGRPLTSQETPHHIDGNRQNNKITNLYLFPDRGSHISHERQYKAGKVNKLKSNIKVLYKKERKLG